MDLTNENIEVMPFFKQKRKMPFTMTVNGIHYRLLVHPTEKVIDLLCDRLLLLMRIDPFGVDRDENYTILIEGELINTSMLMAHEVNGKSLTIIKGMHGKSN